MARNRGFPTPLLKVFVLAAFGVGACIWALVRAHRPRPAMVVPVVPSASAPPLSSSEILAPDLLGEDSGAPKR